MFMFMFMYVYSQVLSWQDHPTNPAPSRRTAFTRVGASSWLCPSEARGRPCSLGKCATRVADYVKTPGAVASVVAVAGGMRVLVTGATRGLGRAIAQAIAARDGEHVIYLGCRDMRTGTALAAALSCSTVQVVPFEVDVTKSATVAAAALAIAACSAGSPLDALVNNAGVMLERDGCDLASIVEPTLSINLDGVIAATESFMPLLREGGRIINVSSGAGTRATASLGDSSRAALDAADVQTLRATVRQLAQAAAALPREPGDTPIYGLSKAGVNFYTRLVAREAPGLLVNACSPGFCRTEIAGPDVVYTREPKDVALGADVVVKLLFGELGSGTGLFYKECSKPGTTLEAARSAAEPWW